MAYDFLYEEDKQPKVWSGNDSATDAKAREYLAKLPLKKCSYNEYKLQRKIMNLMLGKNDGDDILKGWIR